MPKNMARRMNILGPQLIVQMMGKKFKECHLENLKSVRLMGFATRKLDNIGEVSLKFKVQ